MYVFNKLVRTLVNPLTPVVCWLVFVLVFVPARRYLTFQFFMLLGWIWFWAMPLVGYLLVRELESDYPVRLAEEMPTADAILLLGGGVGGCKLYPYADLSDAADRAWHAARLWKVGKAPFIIPSNAGAEFADVRLLVDLGVPREALIIENRARNTEENAKFLQQVLKERLRTNATAKPKVLLVTSAYHMRRSMLMFEKYAKDVEVIPAATDYRVLPYVNEPKKLNCIIPSAGALGSNDAFLHEYLGYWGYRLFR